MKTVEEIMTKELITVTPATTIRELAEIFVTRRIGSLPVLDDSGRIAGMVTESDLVEQGKNIHLPTVITLFDWVIYLESEKSLETELHRMGAGTVAEIYKPNPVTISPDQPASAAADLMSSHHVNAIPVVKDGALVGIVSRIDIIRTLLL